MKKSKRAKLEAAGWAVGSVQEFLGLSDAEAALIEMKLSLSRSLRGGSGSDLTLLTSDQEIGFREQSLLVAKAVEVGKSVIPN